MGLNVKSWLETCVSFNIFAFDEQRRSRDDWRLKLCFLWGGLSALLTAGPGALRKASLAFDHIRGSLYPFGCNIISKLPTQETCCVASRWSSWHLQKHVSSLWARIIISRSHQSLCLTCFKLCENWSCCYCGFEAEFRSQQNTPPKFAKLSCDKFYPMHQ